MLLEFTLQEYPSLCTSTFPGLEMLDNTNEQGSLQAVNGGLDCCVETPHEGGQGQMLLWTLHCILPQTCMVFALRPLQHWV